jgi:transposase
MGKAYSLDFRQQVLKTFYKKLVKLGKETKGNFTKSVNYTTKFYNIARTTLFYWIKKDKNGSLDNNNKNCGNKSKVDINKLNEILYKNNNLTLNEIAAIFNVHSTTIYYALKRNSITFKKKNYDIMKVTQMK